MFLALVKQRKKLTNNLTLGLIHSYVHRNQNILGFKNVITQKYRQIHTTCTSLNIYILNVLFNSYLLAYIDEFDMHAHLFLISIIQYAFVAHSGVEYMFEKLNTGNYDLCDICIEEVIVFQILQ